MTRGERACRREAFDFFGNFDAARFVTFQFECFGDYRNDFAGEEAGFLRGESAVET